MPRKTNGLDIKTFKEYYKNPRTITAKQLKLLERDLLELGDLSGIVHDLNSNQIIGGNQRLKVFRAKAAKLQISEKFNPPTPKGTIALGYIKLAGEKFSYRQVKWTEQQCEKGNIVANKAGGGWDMDKLANQFEIPALQDYGFENWELGISDSISYDDMKRPSFTDDSFDEGVIENTNYFYVQYYEDTKLYNRLKKKIQDNMLTQHRIDPTFFYKLIMHGGK